MQSQEKTPPESDGIVADAPAKNWVDHRAPKAWRPYLRLSRADRPIGTWLLLLPCWWGVGLAMMADAPAWRDLWIVIACGIGAIVMRGAGCTWNDITDRDIDAQVARTRSRPLPSGAVSLRQALIWLAAQGLVGLVVLVTLGWPAIWMGIASLTFVAIYPFAKRFTWWPQIFLGLAFNWGVMLAYVAHTGHLAIAPVIAWLAGIAWTIVYDTIYAHQDAEDDALIGVKSTARLFGDASPGILRIFAALTLVLLFLATAIAAGSAASLVIAWLGVAAFGGHLLWQLRNFTPDDGTVCLRIFRSNRDAGLILALFLAIAGLL